MVFNRLKESIFIRNIVIFFAVMGPGIITASVGNNSAGIATYSLAGAHFGYSLLWSFLPMTFALIIAQEMCARMAIATGKGLADLIRENFGVKVTFYLMLLLLLTNLICVVAEFSGIAASLEIFNVSKYISVPLAAMAVWFLIVKGTYKLVERIFLTLSLFYIAYIVSGVLAKPNWGLAVKQVFAPEIHLNFESTIMLIGMIGTTITPWMQFYIQSSIVEKRVDVQDRRLTQIDVWIGCIVASVVAFFIVITCAATLHQDAVNVQTVKEAAVALKPLAGEYASMLFAFGLFNAAIFAVSILPLSTSYSICEGMGWEVGVDKRFEEAPQFFGLYTFLIVVGAAVVLIPNFPLLKVMYFSQVSNGILLPLILIFMLSLVNNKEVMGEFANKLWLNILTILTIGFVITINFLMVIFSLIY